MKTTILLLATLLCGPTLQAQNKGKGDKVHIKKVETINGVTRITDTTFTTNDPGSLHMEGLEIINETENDGKTKVIVMNLDDSKDGEKGKKVIYINTGDPSANAHSYSFSTSEGGEGNQTVIVKSVQSTGKKGDGTKKEVLVSCIITSGKCTDEEKKMLEKTTGLGDNKLEVDNMSFYPNPANGKFNLSFSLPQKGNTDITIVDMEGKTVYSEKLGDFTGKYEKEIDISKNPKGVYFVKVTQGKHAQLKKIVLE